MEKTYKRVPFDIELAKKIQAGEIEGRFISSKGDPVRIICFNYRNLKKEYHILFAVEYSTHEGIFSCDDEGRVDANNFRLYIELPEETPKQEVRAYSKEEAAAYKIGYECGIEACEKAYKYMAKKEIPKHEFKPFDKVLVRDVDKDTWRPRLYSCKGRVGYCMQDNYEYMQILPYEGHEHLVGTTNNPE